MLSYRQQMLARRKFFFSPPVAAHPSLVLAARAALSCRQLTTFPTDVIPDALTPSSKPLPSTDSDSSRLSRQERLDEEVEKGKRKVAFLYFDSVFPIRVGVWDIRYLFARIEQKALLDKIKSLVPEDSAYEARVEDVYARAKDGGAFVKFSFVAPEAPYADQVKGAKDHEELEAKEKGEERVLKVMEKAVTRAVATRGYKPWFTWGENRAFLVQGKPWMEDMNRFPNNMIRVEFEGAEIPQEELYALFRPYGRIRDILPQPSSNKDTPRWANISYKSLRSAAAARNSLHAAAVTSSIGGPNSAPTVLRILYGERVRSRYIRDFATSHPRLMLPLLVALLGGISYAVFDPIRQFFVRCHIEGTFDSSRWKALSWLKRETLGRLGLNAKSLKSAAITGIEKEREEAKTQLSKWLRDVPDTFTVVTGPKGSGKSSLVDEVLKDGKNVLTIDCEAICKNARTDVKLVNELASAVGYWPQFVLAASVNNLIDLASVGLIGQKAGFSANLDTQLKSILEVTSGALHDLATETREKAKAVAKKAEYIRQHATANEQLIDQLRKDAVKDGRIDTVSGSGIMSELGTGVENPKDGKFFISGPQSAAKVKFVTELHDEHEVKAKAEDRLPVVVIKGFASKGEGKEEILWEVLADWAAVLVENQVAHVIFTSDNVTGAKQLSKALPNKPFSSITLTDASPDSAIQYVESKLAEVDKTLSIECKPAVARLGGRQTDLELLVQKIKAGLTPEQAVADIIARNATELRKSIFGDDDEEAKSLKWTREQAWALVKGLVQFEELKYADVLVNAPFKSNESALKALENIEMISIHHRDGRPSVIKPGKPVHRSAFQTLLTDPVFAASIEYQINASATVTATADLDTASQALIQLSQLFGGAPQNGSPGRWIFGGGTAVPKEIEVRVSALLKAIRDAEAKIEKLDAQKTELLNILKTAD